MRTLTLLLVLTTVAAAQNSRFDGVAQGPKGPVPFASVAVCTQPATTTTQPCSPLANLCSSLTDLTCTQPNPLAADNLGNYHFYFKNAQAPLTVQLYGANIAQAVVLTDQSAQTGTLAASNTWTGPNTFTGSLTATGTTGFLNINNTQMCDQFAGATADVKVNACITALPSTGGTADARGLIGAQTVAAEIDVGGPAGSPTKFVNLIVPCGAIWNVTITGGTASALKVFGGSSIVSLMCAQNSGFELKLAAAGNVASLVTNDQTCAACSFKLHGMMLFNNLGGTVANAMLDLSNLGNNAEVSSINVANFKAKGLWIHGTNSESTFTAVNVDGVQTAGNVPCTIETTATSLETMRFFGLDCQHPAAGNNVLVINGHGAGNLCCLTFVGSHFEGNNVDTTTPFTSVADAKNITFYSPFFNSLTSGTTNWGVNISQTVANLTDGISVVNETHSNGNYINDTINTKTVTGNGVLPYYNFGAVNNTVPTPALVVARGTAAMTTASVAAVSGTTVTCGTTVTVAATGTVSSDTIAFAPTAAPTSPNVGLIIQAWPTTNNVNFVYCNPTASALTPVAETLNWRVVR